MARIVCVHGVGKQVSGERSLLREWRPALGDGLTRAGGVQVPAEDVAMAFYGDLFRPAGELLAVGDPMYGPRDQPGLVDARNEIIELFTGELGYRHVSDLGLNPDEGSLTRHLRTFCRSADRRPDDLLAVYIAGHGEVLEGSRDHVG